MGSRAANVARVALLVVGLALFALAFAHDIWVAIVALAGVISIGAALIIDPEE